MLLRSVPYTERPSQRSSYFMLWTPLVLHLLHMYLWVNSDSVGRQAAMIYLAKTRNKPQGVWNYSSHNINYTLLESTERVDWSVRKTTLLPGSPQLQFSRLPVEWNLSRKYHFPEGHCFIKGCSLLSSEQLLLADRQLHVPVKHLIHSNLNCTLSV